MLRSREREALYRAGFARLSKVVVFCGTFECTSKGYVERETSLTRERGGYLFRVRFARLSKVVVFCGTFVCTSKGYVERELIYLALLERERGSYSGLAMLASQKWWFSVALLGAPVGGK